MSGWGAITDSPVYILWGECVHAEGEGEKIVRNGWWRCAAAQNRKNFVYYESMKRKLKRKPIYQYECRYSKKGLDVTLEGPLPLSPGVHISRSNMNTFWSPLRRAKSERRMTADSDQQ